MTAARRALLALLGALALMMALFQVPIPAAEGQKASGEIAKAATVVYVSLRAVNAALSVSQEVEVGATVGVSATGKPLKVLDPVDDTIERVAAVVFAIAAASWVLSVAFKPVAVIGFAVLGLGLIGAAMADRWHPVAAPARSATRLGLMLALVLPLVYAGGARMGRLATEGVQAEAAATLDGVASEARKLIGRDENADGVVVEAETGWFSGLFDGAGQIREQVGQFTRAADYYWSNADVVLEAAFVLIAVFVLRILVIPFVLLFLLWRLLGSAL